ncbi:MAG: prolyl oligopeptidase family serine peptidase [Verrucomicrobiae bacterium]|nr:prolyl oligopeptidase family serine peptidase [Verrucomicrobiae bacterium]
MRPPPDLVRLGLLLALVVLACLDTVGAQPAPGTPPRVYRDRVEPNWFAGDTRFWYRNDLANDTREFLVVHAVEGTRSPAFNHALVANRLGTLLQRPVHPDRLPVDTLRFSELDDIVTLQGSEGTWRWNPGRAELTPDPDAPADQGRPAEANASNPPPSPRRARQPQTPTPVTSVPSPDGRWEAFVRDHNLWVRDTQSGAEHPLAFDGNPGHSFQQDIQRARLVEMRYDAPEPPETLPRVFWSPDSRKLLALQTRSVPERRVHLIHAAPRDRLQPRLDSYPYLKPGDDLPVATPRLFGIDPRREVTLNRDLHPIPWNLSHFRWDPDSSRVIFLYNERGHQRLRVLAAPWPSDPDATASALFPLLDEPCDTFFDYSNKTHLEFLPGTDEFLWMSERSGWNHLYLLDARTGHLHNAVTHGPWVVRGVDRVDPETRRVWFRACGIRPGEDPYHAHLARVNLDGSGLSILTEGDGTHSVQWSPSRRYFLDTWSRVDAPPITALRDGESGALIVLLEQADASEVLAARGRFPQRFVAPGRDGATDIWGILHRPRDFDPAHRYPVVENIYAGPHGQHVPKAFRATYRHQEEIADRGFVVVQIDGMGTNWRHKAFHDVAWRNLGDAGFPDRIAWLHAAARHLPFLDLDRIGIYGGSAGGQNALRALLAHGGFYRAAAADCGCHDNRMDKIWWNEAWMGWPVGPHYAEQSNVTQAHRLQGALLLTVGELDRNVDPASTTQVVDALIRAGHDFEFLLLPGAGHGAGESEYARRRRADFLARHLLPASSPAQRPLPATPSPR